jgi:hypothetical protein
MFPPHFQKGLDMSAILAVTEAGSPWFWLFFGVPLAWVLFMMTFRTSDFIRLVKEDQERKARAQERRKEALKGAFIVAKWWLKK